MVTGYNRVIPVKMVMGDASNSKMIFNMIVTDPADSGNPRQASIIGIIDNCRIVLINIMTLLISGSLTPLGEVNRMLHVRDKYTKELVTITYFPDRGTCARDRRALQQLALNVHIKHSDLT